MYRYCIDYWVLPKHHWINRPMTHFADEVCAPRNVGSFKMLELQKHVSLRNNMYPNLPVIPLEVWCFRIYNFQRSMFLGFSHTCKNKTSVWKQKIYLANLTMTNRDLQSNDLVRNIPCNRFYNATPGSTHSLLPKVTHFTRCSCAGCLGFLKTKAYMYTGSTQ